MIYKDKIRESIRNNFTGLLCDEKVEVIMDVVAELAFDENPFLEVAQESLIKNLEKAINRQLNLNSDEIEGEE